MRHCKTDGRSGAAATRRNFHGASTQVVTAKTQAQSECERETRTVIARKALRTKAQKVSTCFFARCETETDQILWQSQPSRVEAETASVRARVCVHFKLWPVCTVTGPVCRVHLIWTLCPPHRDRSLKQSHSPSTLHRTSQSAAEQLC